MSGFGRRLSIIKRVERILNHPDFKAYMAMNTMAEVRREFCIHQMGHAFDVARIGYILLLEAGATAVDTRFKGFNPETIKEMVYGAGLLHDIGRWKQYQDSTVDHAREGATVAAPLLRDSGFIPTERALMVEAIGNHRNPEGHGLGKILYRADKLSRDCKRCKVKDNCYKINQMETAAGIIY